VAHKLILFKILSASHYQQYSHFHIYSCHYLFFKQFICRLAVLILYPFVLLHPWEWWFIAETCRRIHVYGWFSILYQLRAFVGIYGWLWLYL